MPNNWHRNVPKDKSLLNNWHRNLPKERSLSKSKTVCFELRTPYLEFLRTFSRIISGKASTFIIVIIPVKVAQYDASTEETSHTVQ